MLSESDLRELLEFSPDKPVLSIYLNRLPSEGNADAHKLRLRNMLKDLPLRQDVAVIERFFDHEYDWSGRSIAVFSCAAKGFFRTYPQAISIPDQVYVSDRPVVNPLVDILDAFGGYGVALVDKQGARLFFFHIGELREQEGVLGEEVRHTKRGGASALPGRRGGMAGQTHYADEVVERNMKETVDFAIRFFEENHVRRILIGGTEENSALFRGLLPKAWQSLVVGTFAMGMTASHIEVLNKTMQIGAEAEAQREAHLVEAAITAAAKGSGGTIGIDATLTAIHHRQIQTLLVTEGYHMPGYHCKGCGYLTTIELDACPFCSSAFEILPDAVEHAVTDTLKNGGVVEVIHYDTALVQAGKIGAILRY